jgi:hypothetical protein
VALWITTSSHRHNGSVRVRGVEFPYRQRSGRDPLKSGPRDQKGPWIPPLRSHREAALFPCRAAIVFGVRLISILNVRCLAGERSLYMPGLGSLVVATPPTPPSPQGGGLCTAR